MKKRIFLLAALMMLSASAAGCGQESNAPPATSETGKRTDFTMAIGSGIGTLDPYYRVAANDAIFTAHIYESLVRLLYVDHDDGSVSLSPVPLLAESWEISADGLRYTFHLREDAVFHDGTGFTASDVIFSVNRAREAPMMQMITDAVSNIEAPDDYTVVFTLDEPFSPFFNNIGALSIMSEAHVNKAGDKIVEDAVGTGPYYLSETLPEQKYVLTAFEDYYGGEAAIQTVTVKVIPDSTTAMTAFENGELDYVGVQAADWSRISQSGKYATYLFDQPMVYFMCYNLEKEPFDNLKLRQAMSYAVDVESINIIVSEGTAMPATKGFAPPLIFGAQIPDNVFSYDPEKAKALLEEAGYPDGIDIGTIETVADGRFDKMAQVIQQNFADIGIKCSIETLESNTGIERVINGTYDISVMAIGLLNDYHYWGYVYESKYINAVNYSRYANPQVDRLFEESARETDPTKRLEIYGQIVNITNDDAAYIPLVYGTATTATDKNLCSGVSMRNFSFYDLYWN